jgi:pimeloyl-ACP methyl ester carboxylesterase
MQKDEVTPVTPDILGEEKLPKEVLAFINLIFESYTPIQELPLYTDEELLQLNMPVLFLDGENDIIIDSQKSAQRLSQLIPSAEVHLLANTGHVVTNSTEYILPFLRKIKQI